jgi:hypothetical protein
MENHFVHNRNLNLKLVLFVYIKPNRHVRISAVGNVYIIYALDYPLNGKSACMISP